MRNFNQLQMQVDTGAKGVFNSGVCNFICRVVEKDVILQRQNSLGPSCADNREPCENHGLTRNCKTCVEGGQKPLGRRA